MTPDSLFSNSKSSGVATKLIAIVISDNKVFKLNLIHHPAMAEGIQQEQEYYEKLYSERAAADSADLSTSSIDRGEKRRDYWSWEKFHMSIAFLAAKRSKDPMTKVCYII